MKTITYTPSCPSNTTLTATIKSKSAYPSSNLPKIKLRLSIKRNHPNTHHMATRFPRHLHADPETVELTTIQKYAIRVPTRRPRRFFQVASLEKCIYCRDYKKRMKYSYVYLRTISESVNIDKRIKKKDHYIFNVESIEPPPVTVVKKSMTMVWKKIKKYRGQP